MSTVDEARAVVYDRFLANWTQTDLTSAATFENEAFDPPETEWVRLTVRNIGSQQDSLGPVGFRKYLRKALVLLQIFTPANTGMQRSGQIAQAFRELYEGVTVDGVRFYDVVVRESGLDGRWQLTVAESTFDYDETR